VINGYPNLAWPSGPYTFPNNAQVPVLMTWLNACAAQAPGSTNGGSSAWINNMSYLGAAWDQGMFGYALGNTLLARIPVSQLPHVLLERRLGLSGNVRMSSFHPGGGNVAMGGWFRGAFSRQAQR